MKLLASLLQRLTVENASAETDTISRATTQASTTQTAQISTDRFTVGMTDQINARRVVRDLEIE